MSLGLWPEAVPFDPDDDTAIDELRRHFDSAALPAAILLVAARSLRDSDWAAKAARGFARALAGKRPVVLADLDFDQPALHNLVGASNAEGVADALLFGASLERVTVQPPGEPFEFVPAGAFAPEPDQLMSNPAWARVFAELSARDALLLAWAPLGASGLDDFAVRVASVVIFAEDIDVTPTVAMLPETIRVEGVIKPPPPPPEPTPAPPPPEAPAISEPQILEAPAPPPAEPAGLETGAASERILSPKDEAREALIADLRARQPQAPPEAPPDGPPASPPPAEVAQSRAPIAALPAGSTGRWLRIAGVVAVLGVIAWFIGRFMAGRTRPAPHQPAAQTADGDAHPAGDILGYSVAIDSWDRMDDALKREDSLAAAQPGVQFYVVPIELDSATFYRVMAGPMLDSASADATMQGLVAQGLKTAATPGDVRSTPLAFELGRYDLREDALNRMTELKSRGVPSYVIEVPYTRGSSRYHVYSGAFSGPSEAERMRQILRQAGLQDTLVLRVGRITP